MKKLLNLILTASLFYTIFTVTADILLGTGMKDRWDGLVDLAKKRYEEMKSKHNDVKTE